jgi:hypothetical protein
MAANIHPWQVRVAGSLAVNPEVHRLFAERAKSEAKRRDTNRKMLAELFGKQVVE